MTRRGSGLTYELDVKNFCLRITFNVGFLDFTSNVEHNNSEDFKNIRMIKKSSYYKYKF